MKKPLIKNLIILLLLIVLITLIVYIIKITTVEIPETEQDCINLEAIYKDACYMQVATTNQDETICQKIVNQEQQDLCLLNIAKQKQEPFICTLIHDKGYLEARCRNELS